jgi:hypothetical protein
VVVSLLVELEDEFGIEIPDHPPRSLMTVGDVRNLVAELSLPVVNEPALPALKARDRLKGIEMTKVIRLVAQAAIGIGFSGDHHLGSAELDDLRKSSIRDEQESMRGRSSPRRRSPSS